MATAPRHACVVSGCPSLLPSGYPGGRCSLHRLPEKPRPTAAQRGYGPQWQRIRARFLQEHPYCAVCGQPATEPHHILALAQGGTHDDENLMSMCHHHHSMVTAKIGGGFGNRRG